MEGQLASVRQNIRNIQEQIVKYEQRLAAAERAGNKGVEEEVKFLRGQLLSLNNQLLSLQEKENILLRSQAPSASTQAGHVSVDVADGPVEMVDCETNEPSIKPFTVPRNWRGQLDVKAIEKGLAASQHILEGIVHGNRHGYPACKDGWTCTSYNGTPIQIQVAPKPVEDEGYKFKDLMHKWALLGVGACVCIVWTIYYGVFSRSPGNPPTG